MTGVAILVDGVAIRLGQVVGLDGVDFKCRPAPARSTPPARPPPAELDVGRRWVRAQPDALGLQVRPAMRCAGAHHGQGIRPPPIAHCRLSLDHRSIPNSLESPQASRPSEAGWRFT